MLILGICGPSGSGKTTLAHRLCQCIGDDCLVLNHDNYYRNHPDMSFEERCQINYDEPGVFDHDLFLQDMQLFLQGKPITRKSYNYTQHQRNDEAELIYPPKVLIVEGIHCFFDERLRNLMFLKIYICVDPDICLLRRIIRDMNERGRSIESIATQYLATVKPMYEQYIRHYIDLADVIVAKDGQNDRIVKIISKYVCGELQEENEAVSEGEQTVLR